MKLHKIFKTAILFVVLLACFGGASIHAGQTTGGDQTQAAAYAKPGFHVEMEDGRLWIFKEGSKELEDFQAKGELAKHVIRPGAGPGGITLKAPDAETLDDYLTER